MEHEIRFSREALERAKQVIRIKGSLSASDVHAILTADGVDCPPVEVLEKNMEAWKRTGIYDRLQERTVRAMRPDQN